MGEDVDLGALAADLRSMSEALDSHGLTVGGMSSTDVRQAADIIEKWAQQSAVLHRLAEIVRDASPVITASARRPEPAKWTLWGVPAVEWDIWPHRIRLEPGDGGAIRWAVLTVQLGRGPGHGSYAFDGSVSPSSGAAPTAVDAARAALAALGVEATDG